MTRFKFSIVALIVGLSSPLAIGFAAAQYDPYAPPRPRGNNLSKGVQTYDDRNDANVRLGTACRLKIYGEDVFSNGPGICNISRGVGGDRDRVTIIDTGAKKYKIVRDPYDNRSGTFYAGNRDLGEVTAQGSCWRGEDVLFCAN